MRSFGRFVPPSPLSAVEPQPEIRIEHVCFARAQTRRTNAAARSEGSKPPARAPPKKSSSAKEEASSSPARGFARTTAGRPHRVLADDGAGGAPTRPSRSVAPLLGGARRVAAGGDGVGADDPARDVEASPSTTAFAATLIQTAFRGFAVRSTLKCVVKLWWCRGLACGALTHTWLAWLG